VRKLRIIIGNVYRAYHTPPDQYTGAVHVCLVAEAWADVKREALK
jgi:hypothetical protein